MDIEIKEFKGLWTFGDQDDIPSEYLSVCKNAISKFGKLIKTYGFYNFDASQVAISPASGYTVYGMVCHVDSNYTTPTGYKYYLVTINASNLLKIYGYSTGTHTWTALSLTNTYYHKAALRNPIITTFDAVRFLPGNVGLADGTHESKGLWYGYIDRDYFWNSAIATKAGFHESITTPQIATTLINAITIDAASEPTVSGHPLAAGTYYYKLTLVFDGTQETLFPITYTYSAIDGTHAMWIQYAMLLSAFNYRVTGVNIYRSDTSAVSDYKLIKQISTLDATYDANLEYNTGSVVGWGLYIADAAFTADAFIGYMLYIDGESGKHIISDNSTDVLVVGDSVDKYWDSATDVYIQDTAFTPFCGNDCETNDVTDWALTDIHLFGRTNFNPYRGTYCLTITSASDDGYALYSPSPSGYITIEANTDYYLSFALKMEAGADDINIDISLGANPWVNIINETSVTWAQSFYQFNSGSDTLLRIRIRLGNTSGYEYGSWIDDMYLYKIRTDGESIYGGIDTIIDPDFDFDRNDNLIGYRALVGTNANGNNDASAERFRIIHNVQRAVQLHTDVSAPYRGNNLKSYICNDYLWQDSATAGCVDLWFYDDGINAGSAHPLEDEVSIKVNGKFARILNDRLYQYNVVLDPGGKNESRPNGLTYSEINDSNIGSQFDVNPVSNFITLPDREGGEGTGLAVQFGGLIAFKKRAIFRLIPDATTGDATDIRESKYNEGNIAPNGYVEAGNDVYYCAYSSINRLNPNIGAETEATPLAQDRISEPIRDVYMALTDSQKELIQAEFDQLNNEIVYRFKNDSTYAYKIDTGEWREIDSALYVDNMGLDESSNLMIYDNTNKKVYKVTSDLSATDATKEAVAFNIRTKEFYIGDDEKSQVVRYFFIVYKSAVALTLNMYADNDNTTVVSTTTIPASTVVTQLRLAVRYWCGRFVMEVLESSGSYSAVEIHSMKIVTD